MRLIPVVVVALLIAGCDSKATPGSPVPSAAPAPSPSPEPKAPAWQSPWAGFKKGAWAQYESTFKTDEREDKSGNRHLLKEVQADFVVITDESRSALGNSSMDTKQSLKRAPEVPKGQVDGRESITVKAGTFDCTWVEFTIVAGEGSATTRVWSNPKVPGGVVKSVSTGKGGTPYVSTTELAGFADGP